MNDNEVFEALYLPVMSRKYKGEEVVPEKVLNLHVQKLNENETVSFLYESNLTELENIKELILSVNGALYLCNVIKLIDSDKDIIDIAGESYYVDGFDKDNDCKMRFILGDIKVMGKTEIEQFVVSRDNIPLSNYSRRRAYAKRK